MGKGLDTVEHDVAARRAYVQLLCRDSGCSGLASGAKTAVPRVAAGAGVCDAISTFYVDPGPRGSPDVDTNVARHLAKLTGPGV